MTKSSVCLQTPGQDAVMKDDKPHASTVAGVVSGRHVKYGAQNGPGHVINMPMSPVYSSPCTRTNWLNKKKAQSHSARP